MRSSRGGPRGGRGGSNRGGRRSAESSGDEAASRKTRRVRFDASADGNPTATGQIVKAVNNAISSNNSAPASESSSKASSSTVQRGTPQKPRRGGPSSRQLVNNAAKPRTAPNTKPPPMQTSSMQANTRPQSSLSSPNPQPFQQRYQALKKTRERERQEAIKNGFLADPDKPRTLAEAITPVGTCPHMCPEFERVERVVQNDVWGSEYSLSSLASQPSNRQPDESRMIKKFRRAAAGIDEQLPSDLRPPEVLRMTTNYLFNDLLREAESLADVHHFIWDRTRAIRNDFSIQQLTKIPDLRVAIDCYERIARFHIASLHTLALAEKPYDKYDAQQEREQLDKTLLSLIQYYDDNRQRLRSPNEPEFRAYCIVFQIQNPIPDLEDRIQTWPDHVVRDQRVQRALEIYAAACNVEDKQGPLKPLAPQPIAQGNWGKFWNIVRSNRISYLMSCVAEIYFPLVRRIALHSIWNTYRAAKRTIEDWSLEDLAPALGFDDLDDVEAFCEHYGFTVSEREDGTMFLNLESVSGHQLPAPTQGTQVQRRSDLVEKKRHYRLLTAVINGLSVRAAREAGLIEDISEQNQELDNDGSLFLPDERNSSHNQEQSQSIQNFGDVASESSFSHFELNGPQGQETPNAAPNFSHFASNNALFKPLEPTAAAFTPNQPFSQPEQGFSNGQSPLPNFSSSDGTATSKTTNQNFKNPFASVTWNTPSEPTANNFERKNTTTSSIFSQASSQPSSTPTGFDSNLFSQQQTSYTPPAPTFSDQSNPFAFLSQPENTSSLKRSIESSNTPSLFTSNPKSSESVNPFQQNAHTPAETISNTSSSNSLFDRVTKAPQFQGVSFEPTATRQFPSSNDQATDLFKTSQPFNISSDASTKLLPASDNITYQNPQTVTFDQAGLQTIHPPSQSHQPPNISSTPPPPSSYPQLSFEDTQPSSSQVKEVGDQRRSEEQEAETIEQLSRALVTQPEGFMEQYVDIAVGPMIAQIKQQIIQQQRDQEAENFRLSKLERKYGRKWREIYWRRRLARQGRERRQRMIKQRQERERTSKESSVSSTMEDFRKSLSSSRSSDSERISPQQTSIPKPSSPEPQKIQLNPSATPSQEHVQKTAASSSISNSQAGHKRSESVPENLSHSRGRRDRPHSSLRNSFLPEDSFLGSSFASSKNFSSVDTTRSTYFRLKALGLNPSDSTSSSDRKRSRSDSLEGLSSYTPSKKLLTPARATSPAKEELQQQHNRASASMDRSANAEDEELFAAVRQTRQAMSDSISFFKEELAKDEELKRSKGSGGSPSTPNFSPPGGTSDQSSVLNGKSTMHNAKKFEPPPAYRNRISKFLPRELYADVQMQQRRDLGQRVNQPPLQASHRKKTSVTVSSNGNNIYNHLRDLSSDHSEDQNTTQDEDDFSQPDEPDSPVLINGKGGTSVEDAIEL